MGDILKKDNNGNANDRILWVDLLRICAMLGVISIHVGSSIDWSTLSSIDHSVMQHMGDALNCCVPLFYMLSGMLMLQKEPNIRRIYTNKIPRLIAAIVIRLVLIASLILIVALMGFVVYGREFRREVFDNFASRDNSFLYCLIGLYLVEPVLYKICQSKKLEEYFLILSFFFSICVPIVESAEPLSWLTKHVFGYLNVYLPVGYPMLFVLGHYIYKYWFLKISNHKGVVTVSMIISIMADIFIRSNNIGWIQASVVPYVSLCELIIAVPIFCFFGTIISCWEPHSLIIINTIKHMGKNSIAIFVLHWVTINLFGVIGIVPSAGHYFMGRIIEVVAVYIMCYLISLIWERIPILRKVIVS